jgi:hypothetical protein
MSKHLYNLRGVPEDELDEIRSLLLEHHIDFYETPAGNWGISSPAAWLNDAGQLAEARALLEGYQRQRAASAQSEYRQLQEQGRAERLIDRIIREPALIVLYLLLIAFVLYVSISPFLTLGQ